MEMMHGYKTTNPSHSVTVQHRVAFDLKHTIQSQVVCGNMELDKAFPFPTNFGPLQNLRSYPPRFGQKIAKLYHRFCAKRPIYFGVEMEEATLDLGIHLFSTLQWHDVDWWDDACMESVFRYLRGSKDLRLGDLRELFPTAI